MTEFPPEQTYLTRAWLLAHGWEQANRIPLFQHDPEIIDADLCVIVDRKMYMIAKFHYMGDKAWEPSAMPSSFDVVGVNNNAELIEYDHTRLVLAAFVCHLTGFKVIDRAIGGVYEVTINKTKDVIESYGTNNITPIETITCSMPRTIHGPQADG